MTHGAPPTYIPRGHELHRADVLEGGRLAVVGRQDAHREPEVPEVAPVVRPGKDRKGQDRTNSSIKKKKKADVRCARTGTDRDTTCN